MKDLLLVVEMIAHMEKNLKESINTNELAERSGYSVNRFRQKFFNVTGDTPSGYLRKRKLTEAAKEILSGKRALEVSHDYGYSSQENFITAFRGYFGVTPAEICRMDTKFKRFFSRFREVLNIMEIAGLKQPPLKSTDMGCMKGASDYFDNDLSTAMIYGLSGYGFMLNIHRDLCPSGPYVWNRDRFYSLLRESGLSHVKSYQLKAESTPEERAEVECQLREQLNNGNLCVLGFLESQLFSGYDEEGFLFLSPWGESCEGSVIHRLTYGTWQECLDREGWVCFAVFAPNEKRSDILQAIRKSWEYGLELYREPRKHCSEGYAMNHRGVENWIFAVERGIGNSQGNWWNGQVWSESRRFAADYFQEIKGLFDSEEVDAQCDRMTELYRSSSEKLELISAWDLEDSKKIEYLKELQQIEMKLESGFERLLNLI